MIERRTAVVTIYQGDYLDRIRHLEQKAEAAREAAGDTRMLGEVPEYVRIAEEHDAVVAEATETAIHVKLQALRRSEWRELVDKHPPRTPENTPGATTQQIRDDRAAGFNETTLKEELVPASILEPADFTEDLEDLADVDFQRLYLTAYMLNRGMAADPKANLVSRMTQPNDETSS